MTRRHDAKTAGLEVEGAWLNHARQGVDDNHYWTLKSLPPFRRVDADSFQLAVQAKGHRGIHHVVRGTESNFSVVNSVVFPSIRYSRPAFQDGSDNRHRNIGNLLVALERRSAVRRRQSNPNHRPES